MRAALCCCCCQAVEFWSTLCDIEMEMLEEESPEEVSTHLALTGNSGTCIYAMASISRGAASMRCIGQAACLWCNTLTAWSGCWLRWSVKAGQLASTVAYTQSVH